MELLQVNETIADSVHDDNATAGISGGKPSNLMDNRLRGGFPVRNGLA
jgi:hypothetical protein